MAAVIDQGVIRSPECYERACTLRKKLESVQIVLELSLRKAMDQSGLFSADEIDTLATEAAAYLEDDLRPSVNGAIQNWEWR